MSRKILIVDDSVLARMAAIKILRTQLPEWAIVEASSAEEALAAVKKARPDAVLIDFNMPGKDGITLANQLRDLQPEISMAVISANAQMEVIERAKATGAMYIAKPISLEKLSGFVTALSNLL